MYARHMRSCNLTVASVVLLSIGMPRW